MPTQRFVPVITQAPPSRSAEHSTFARSDPADGSENAIPPIQRPDAERRSSSACRSLLGLQGRVREGGGRDHRGSIAVRGPERGTVVSR